MCRAHGVLGCQHSSGHHAWLRIECSRSFSKSTSCVFPVSDSNPLARTANARQCRRTGMSSNPYVSSTCILCIHRDVPEEIEQYLVKAVSLQIVAIIRGH